MVPSDARYDAEQLAPWLMNVVEKIFAAGMVVAVPAAPGPDAAAAHAGAPASTRRCATAASCGGARVRRLVAWPAAELRARRETKEAIRRARRSAIERDGNVIAPKAFKGRRRDLH